MKRFACFIYKMLNTILVGLASRSEVQHLYDSNTIHIKINWGFEIGELFPAFNIQTASPFLDSNYPMFAEYFSQLWTLTTHYHKKVMSYRVSINNDKKSWTMVCTSAKIIRDIDLPRRLYILLRLSNMVIKFRAHGVGVSFGQQKSCNLWMIFISCGHRLV